MLDEVAELVRNREMSAVEMVRRAYERVGSLNADLNFVVALRELVGTSASSYNTQVQNMTGHPALSVPAGRSPNGVPFDLQITGPREAPGFESFLPAG